jgi:REP element-mobilizing transposase RayT
MSTVRVNKNFNQEAYFLTFTVKRWYYLFDRHNRWNILLDSLKYCQKHKKLEIYNWVFMLNHTHLICKSENMISFIRDFKTFTSKELKKNIIAIETNILSLFEEDGKYDFWQSSNMPEIIINEKFYRTKANYLENNPVRKGYVKKPEYWFFSSANKEDRLLELTGIEH